jgi:hypothetical protein
MKLNLRPLTVCYLRINTWVGSSVCCAEHWYGKLICGPRGDSKEIEVEYVLNKEEAKRLEDDDPCPTHPYKAGETSHRFLSKAALLKAAAACWKTHFPSARFLIEGDPSASEPQWIISGPEDVKERVNALFAECERLNWWDGDSKQVARLCNDWMRIWKREIEKVK